MLVIIDGDTDNTLAHALRKNNHTVLAAPHLSQSTEKYWLAAIAARHARGNGIHAGTVYATRSHHALNVDTGATVHILATRNAELRASDLGITTAHARDINTRYWDAYFKMQKNCRKGNKYAFVI